MYYVYQCKLQIQFETFHQMFSTTITNKGQSLSGSGTVCVLSALLITIHTIFYGYKNTHNPKKKKNKNSI